MNRNTGLIFAGSMVGVIIAGVTLHAKEYYIAGEVALAVFALNMVYIAILLERILEKR